VFSVAQHDRFPRVDHKGWQALNQSLKNVTPLTTVRPQLALVHAANTFAEVAILTCCGHIHPLRPKRLTGNVTMPSSSHNTHFRFGRSRTSRRKSANPPKGSSLRAKLITATSAFFSSESLLRLRACPGCDDLCLIARRFGGVRQEFTSHQDWFKYGYVDIAHVASIPIRRTP